MTKQCFPMCGTCLECFDGDGRCVVPQSLPNLPKLAVTELPDELQAGPVDLPVVPRVVRQSIRGRLLDLRRGKWSNKGLLRTFLELVWLLK